MWLTLFTSGLIALAAYCYILGRRDGRTEEDNNTTVVFRRVHEVSFDLDDDGE